MNSSPGRVYPRMGAKHSDAITDQKAATASGDHLRVHFPPESSERLGDVSKSSEDPPVVGTQFKEAPRWRLTLYRRQVLWQRDDDAKADYRVVIGLQALVALLGADS